MAVTVLWPPRIVFCVVAASGLMEQEVMSKCLERLRCEFLGMPWLLQWYTMAIDRGSNCSLRITWATEWAMFVKKWNWHFFLIWASNLWISIHGTALLLQPAITDTFWRSFWACSEFGWGDEKTLKNKGVHWIFIQNFGKEFVLYLTNLSTDTS